MNRSQPKVNLYLTLVKSLKRRPVFSTELIVLLLEYFPLLLTASYCIILPFSFSPP